MVENSRLFAQRGHSARTDLGGVFAQRAHSANCYGVYPGHTPANHPPTAACLIHSTQRRGCRAQNPGTRGYRRWKTAAFSRSARSAQSAPIQGWPGGTSSPRQPGSGWARAPGRGGGIAARPSARRVAHDELLEQLDTANEAIRTLNARLEPNATLEDGAASGSAQPQEESPIVERCVGTPLNGGRGTTRGGGGDFVGDNFVGKFRL